MYAEELRRAVFGAPRERLAQISAVIWKSYAAGALTEDAAQELAEAVERRKATPVTSVARRFVGARPRSPQSLERRRSWSAGGWLPPAMAAAFTTAELAALSVVIREIAIRGACELPAAAIAGKAGVSTTSARNAVREARKRGILHVQERRVAYDRNRPNLITIGSKELALWIRTRARTAMGEIPPSSGRLPDAGISRIEGGGVRTVTPTTNHLFPSSARPAAGAWKAGLAMGGAARSMPDRHTRPKSTVCRTPL